MIKLNCVNNKIGKTPDLFRFVHIDTWIFGAFSIMHLANNDSIMNLNTNVPLASLKERFYSLMFPTN